jgi:hypothetical protein
MIDGTARPPENTHGWVGQNLAHGFDGAFSEPGPGGEKRQHFGQHFFGRVNAASRQKILKAPDFAGVCVPRTDQGDPAKRIGEDSAHSAFLGTP